MESSGVLENHLVSQPPNHTTTTYMAGSPDVAFLRSPFAVENIGRLTTCEVNLRRTWGQTYLTLATRLGLREVVEALINARADVDCRDNYNATPLCHAIDLPLDTGVLDVLLAAGADTLLVPHYRCGDVRLLRCIKGTAVTTPEPNYPQYHPVSDVLHLAVVRKRGPEHIALLLSYGTNVRRRVMHILLPSHYFLFSLNLRGTRMVCAFI